LTLKNTHAFEDLKTRLDEKAAFYEKPDFVADDPIQIPHLFSQKEDIEIAGFLAATIAWGQRKSILNNAKRIVEAMDMAPHAFVVNHKPSDLKVFKGFVHRTFNEDDLLGFIHALKLVYEQHGGLEQAMAQHPNNIQLSLHAFKNLFFSGEHLPRSRKHVSDPLKGSSAKRLNMFLRWMTRSNSKGVDFGIWTQHAASALHLPLDVHTGRVARRLGLLNRKQDDWKAVEELTQKLSTFDPQDPVKYDFALFGMGVYEG
jgi:uncharacterized protein (TIGR02757 family)